MDDRSDATGKSKNKIRHQHTVSRFYLSGFAVPDNPKIISMYDCQRLQFSPVSVKHAAVRTKFYPQVLENFLADREDLASRISPQIIQGQPVSAGDRWDFSLFLALMLTRVPHFRSFAERIQEQLSDLASDQRLFKKTVERLTNGTGRVLGMAAEALRQYYLSPGNRNQIDLNVKCVSI